MKLPFSAVNTPADHVAARRNISEPQYILIFTERRSDVENIYSRIIHTMRVYVQDVCAEQSTCPVIYIGTKGVTVWKITIWHTGNLLQSDHDQMRGRAFDRVYLYNVMPEQALPYFRLEELEQITDEATGLRYWKLSEKGD